MTPNRVTVAMEKYGPDIPSNLRGAFKIALEQTDDRCMDEFMFLPIKSKGATLIFSILLGGYSVNRFYLGDVLFGILKMFGLFMTILIAASSVSQKSITVSVLSFFFIYIIDIILSYKKAIKINYDRLSTYLFAHHYKTFSSASSQTSTVSTASTAAKSTTAKSTGTTYGGAAKSSSGYTPSTVTTGSGKYTPVSAKANAASAKVASAKAPEPTVTAPTKAADDYSKHSPVKASAKKTDKKPATNDIDAAIAAAIAQDASRISASYAPVKADAKPTESSAPKSEAEAPAKSSAPSANVLDLTFSHIRVDASLAKELGFEDFDDIGRRA